MKESIFCGYTIGSDAFENFENICMPLGRNVLIVGGKTALSVSLDKIRAALAGRFSIIGAAVYGTECCEETVAALFEKYRDSGADFVIGVGGGKALDTAKYLAYMLKKPIVTVPTIASTCAASSAMSVVYTKDHVFSKFMHYEKPAYHCFINTQIIADAPVSFLRAGIGDTLAKFYEVEFSARNGKKTYSDEMALSISAMCNKPLMRDAAKALSDAKRQTASEELENIIRIIVISTGMVSMLINDKYNGAVAHALFYGLTNIDGFELKFLHGDVVAYTTSVQLVLDNNIEEAKKVRAFLEQIGIETTLKQRGITVERKEFEKILTSTLADPDMEVVPYKITADMLFDAIVKTESL